MKWGQEETKMIETWKRRGGLQASLRVTILIIQNGHSLTIFQPVDTCQGYSVFPIRSLHPYNLFEFARAYASFNVGRSAEVKSAKHLSCVATAQPQMALESAQPLVVIPLHISVWAQRQTTLATKRDFSFMRLIFENVKFVKTQWFEKYFLKNNRLYILKWLVK